MNTEKIPPTRFVKVSPSQILSTFPSKIKKDANDNPIMLSRILLPSKEFSKNPIGDYATIVVPSWIITDDKFYKETDHKKYRVLGINTEKSYEVQYNTTEKDEKGYPIKEKVIVSGDRLVEAFTRLEKQKKLDKINDDKRNVDVQEQKRKESKKELTR